MKINLKKEKANLTFADVPYNSFFVSANTGCLYQRVIGCEANRIKNNSGVLAAQTGCQFTDCAPIKAILDDYTDFKPELEPELEPEKVRFGDLKKGDLFINRHGGLCQKKVNGGVAYITFSDGMLNPSCEDSPSEVDPDELVKPLKHITGFEY